MYFSCIEKHRVNSRAQLTKTVRECYTHSNLPVFPPNFQFNKSVLLVTKDIILYYRAVLFTGLYDFVICASTVEELPENVQKALEKQKQLFILFRDDACTETAGLGLQSVLCHIKRLHPSINADILNPENISMLLSPYPESFDVTFMNNQLPLSCNTTFIEYFDNLEYLHRSGEVSRGTLIISPVDRNIGEVLGTNSRVRIAGSKLNRAMHGDKVYVKDGCVVGIDKRKLSTVVGTLYLKEGSCAYIRPIDRRLPEMLAYTSLGDEYVGSKVVVYFMDWLVEHSLPRGVIFKVLSKASSTTDFELEEEAIMRHYGIDYFHDDWLTAMNKRREELGQVKQKGGLFPAGLGEVSSNDENIGSTPESIGCNPDDFSINIAIKEIGEGRREDLRHLNVYSIDPEGCTDIDDALHAVQYDGYVEVGVHIADVSLYVKPDSPLDIEARNRSTTVYFPNKRIDMLPSFLSANLCSLMQGVDRAAFSCVWKFDNDWNVVDMKVFRSVICSKGSLSYEQAYDIYQSEHSTEVGDVGCGLFNKVDNPSVDSHTKFKNCFDSIKLLAGISKKLRSDRIERGALELSAEEARGVKEKGKHLELMYHLVEEFMLLANVHVAKFIYQNNPDYSLLRKHPLPSAIDLDFVDCSSSKAINESLKSIPSENLKIVKRIITRSMQQALYFSSGDSSDFYHYGLATEIYTHFTSPIRRYPDILVHRTLSYILEKDEDRLDGLSSYVTTKACSFMNFRNKNAQYASRMASLLYLYASIEPGVMDATVVAVRDNGYIVFIGEYGLEEYLLTDRKLSVFEHVKVSFIKDMKQFCTTWSIALFVVDEV